MARKLGRSGETRFATLVAEYDGGATCNDSHEDEHGWDHVVEFDNQPIAGVPADLRTALPSIFVQTKTTNGFASLKVKMKLSNALAFTRSNNPCFVVLVSAPVGEPARFHVVHWWETLMARTLKRAREFHRDGVSEALFHKKEISFTMTTADAHAPEALVGWMEQTVRREGRDYAAVKAALRDSVGFGADEFSGTIKVGPITSIEELVDHQLGLTPSIPLEKIVLNHRRFGVDTPFPLPEGPPTFARMQANPVATCEVRVRGPDGESFTTDGELLVPAIPGLPDEHMKYRIRTPIFDVIWQKQGVSKFHCSFDTASLRPPAELEKIARFIGWGGAGEIDIMATLGDDRVFGAIGVLDPQPDTPSWRRLAEPLGTLARLSLARKAGQPLISIDQVLQVEWLDLLHSVVTSTETTLNANLTRKVEVPTFDHCISFAVLTVGDWVFATLIRLPLRSNERTDTNWRVVFGQATLLETYAFQTHEIVQFERLKSDFSRHATRPGAFAIDNMLVHLAGEAGG